MRRPVPHLAVRLAVFLLLLPGVWLSAQQEPQLTVEQKAEFLLKAKVTKSRQTSKGVTAPWRLTLSDGQFTHDALFQSVNERRTLLKLSDGTVEMNFVDSYLYNLAAYELAGLLGIADMMPVTVERSWEGLDGCFSWWLPVQMDEAQRRKKKIDPPDVAAWNRQVVVMRVFSELVYDTDRNLTNTLVGNDWELYMIDFTRAFRLFHELRTPKNLTRCSRSLLEKLAALQASELAEKTRRYLNRSEIEAVMVRRDLIVGYFGKLIAAKGEAAVLF